ncbi:alpha/beta hydrolase [Xenophilus arseniciresistens]|uniref:Alpha/beta hydrolase n=1 Tax=Xenophilus arseniciresistens TaxID=1283306 RepID=A0AAE3NAA1_9BURK|nr:alpha/beta hydrolase [Xenophilus arseniciresistens]MDA7417474.1 alpha/beta hydrolase [Xenophilus arseniciresistens]
MTEPVLDFVHCPDARGGHRMAFWQWGPAQAAHVVLCVHGLTRQGRDFDVLARHLIARSSQPLRVICPDVVGRGRSDWLADPMGYQVPQYASDMLALLHALHARHPIALLDHVGTSMGGLIGMALAGHRELPLPQPVRRLVLNDVGPQIEASALARISAYVGQDMVFDSLASAADAMAAISTGFGPHTPEQWLALSTPMVVPAAARSVDGRARVAGAPEAAPAQGPVRLHYDPAIAQPLRAITPEAMSQAEAAVWALYEAITAPTLLIRGADSDLLSPATAAAMRVRGPRASLIEFEGVGHAPTFVTPEQCEAVSAFLLI